MRANGMRSLDVCCWVCHHWAIMSADPWSDDVPVPAFGPRMVCTNCGLRWRVSPVRARGARRRRPPGNRFKVIIRRSKTNQEGHGETIAIARGVTTCPVKAWLQAAGISGGPLFRSVAQGRPARAAAAYRQERVRSRMPSGSVSKAADFGADSLRAGFLTSAARRGASVFKMRDVSRHKSMNVLQAYVREADLFRDHAGAGLL
jgi:hypothetical protein